MLKSFSPIVNRELGYYVYLYINPIDGSIFYVGKGKWNRVFSHLNLKDDSRKTQIIKEIRSQGLEPRIEILVHGIEDEKTALKIEAAVIDLIGVWNLSNQKRGWESSIVGRMEVGRLMALYDSKPVEIDEPSILIRINRLYRYGMSPEELYETTRGVWRAGSRREAAELAFSIYRGIVLEVYTIQTWYPAGTLHYKFRPIEHVRRPGRWEFQGEVAPKEIRDKYVDKSVANYFPRRSQNPIKYVNC
jgi:hypothetical protein